MPRRAKILTFKEIDLVFKILETPRDRALFGLGIYAGLRVGEIIRLKQDQVFTSDAGVRNKLRVKRLKKREPEYSEIPIHPKLRGLLREYQKSVRDDHWLFPSRESVAGHISRARAHEILATVFETLKLEDASTHSMRRSCLTYMSKAGVPVRTIQKISGHSNLGQLQNYLDDDPEDRLRAINLLKY